MYATLALGVGAVVWGAEFLPGLLAWPGRPLGWLGLALIVAGVLAATATAYVARRGAMAVGVAFLVVTALYAWNMHYWYDPTRVGAFRPSWDFYLAPGLMLALGVFFAVFFRYLYPATATATAPGAKAQAMPGQPRATRGTAAPASRKSGAARTSSMEIRVPLVRLALLAVSVVLALGASRLIGVDDGASRVQVFLGVLVLGCVAAGVISEETLVKIIPWKK